MSTEEREQVGDSRLDRRGLLVCLILAMVLRGLVLWLHADDLSRDRDAYLGIAQSVVTGHGFIDVGRRTPSAFRPPLYPLLLAGALLVFPAVVAVAAINLAWGMIAVWATWRAGLYLKLGWTRHLAALLVAVDPILLQYTAQPMTEVMCAGLVSLLVYWIVRRDCSEPVRQLGTGVLFGALVLCRPTFWPFAGLIAFGWLWQRLRNGARSKLPWRIIVGTLLLVGPWVVRNQVVMGSPIVMTTHGGYTLLLANNPVYYTEVVDRGWGSEWTKPSFDHWTEDLLADMVRQLGPDASELDRDRWQNQRARKFIVAAPNRFLRAAWYRVRSLWSPTPQGEAAAAVNSRLILCVGWYYTVVLTAFAIGLLLAGFRLVTATGSGHVSWWPLLALVLTVQGVHLVYWTNARMRAPIVPVISLLVAGVLNCKEHLAQSDSLATSAR
ncbi:MAG: hypothetical protein JSS49_29550 [Planctomycetes bacterium]|nr:hypothetical protein [Planctomycetota bacterium]